MTLLDEVAREGQPPSSCKVCAILAVLPADDGADLRTALADKHRYRAAAIARVLNNRQHDITESSVKRHRKHAGIT